MKDRENVIYEGSIFTFKANDYREQSMRLEQWERLGGGNFGDIFSVTLSVQQAMQGTLQDSDAIGRVLKVFHIPENAQQAVRKHHFLQRYSFPLFSEYREDASNRGCVLMPNGNCDGRVIVSWNKDSTAYEKIHDSRPLLPDALATAQQSIFPYVNSASVFGFYVPASTYFFHVPSESTPDTDIRISFDDTDEVEECFRSRDLCEFNVRGAEEALMALCTCGIEDSMQSAVGIRIQETCRKWQERIAWEIKHVTDC